MTTQVRRRRTQPKAATSRKYQLLIERYRKFCEKSANPGFIEAFIFAVERKLEHGDNRYFEFMQKLRHTPVDIETFLDSDDFMGATGLKLWPEVKKAIIAVNKYWWKGADHGAITEFLGAGATATGKSEIAKVTTAYHLHIIGCMREPQTYWNLPPATEISIPIFAAKPKVTKNVLYNPLRSYIEVMPWFRRNMRMDKYIEAEMWFPDQKVRVSPVGTDIDTILGGAIIASMIDEINFMQVVKNSRKAEVKAGRSGTYDQAEDIYTRVTRRKGGRFGDAGGPNVGVIATMSSTLYPQEFTERLMTRIKKENMKHIYVYDKAQFQVRPEYAQGLGDNYFHVCIHQNANGTIELRDKDEPIPKHTTVYKVPERERPLFLQDPEGSTRDIIGKSVRALAPFIGKITAIREAFELGEQVQMPQIVEQMNVRVSTDGMPKFVPGHYCRNPSRPRYIHIDLAASEDRCGIAMVRFDGMATVTIKGQEERLPTCTVELAMSLEPDVSEQIELADVRTWVVKLKEDLGYPIRAVSYDGWQSLESRQMLRRKGIPTKLISLDKTSTPYKQFRDAMYGGRVAICANPILEEELVSLQFDAEKDKIDHLPTGSKDIADAVCGAFTLLMTRSSSWLSEDDGGRIMGTSTRYGGDRMDFGERR